MKQSITLIAIIILTGGILAFTRQPPQEKYIPVNELRALYSSGDQSRWPEPFLDSTVAPGFEDIGSLPEMSFPQDNPYSETKKELGKLLFFDPRLSGSKQIACASCHDSEIGWGDGRRFSYGHNRQLGVRNSMTLFNVGYADSLFWDGRAASLEEQIHFPLKDTLEMHSDQQIAVRHIRDIRGYGTWFQKAFGDTLVTFERIKKALATFERTIVSESTRFDRFIQGESDRLSDREVLGLHLFRTKARCINCHNTPLFSDNEFHNTGLTYYGRKYEDLGRYDHTGKKEDVGRFRTGSLREIAVTGPYMHNGLFPHLRGVINLYNAGMPHPKRKAHQLNDSLFPQTSPLLQKLHLTDKEKLALRAFLFTLTSRQRREAPPELPQ
ncbi:cytochrome-c peroxidase [Sinomicrobium kalidii]|uniref:cytochrome-c peroxidase n=1 Tax=Sinomicrobium kalidii TaxID=2900738 RepID=UPI001E521555|nr:cytochrome c peroxidase [Sinomicrobium kalidii]UGU15713.1 cytochrome-c peroxidase [Sinomicrobium kalidii]